MPILEVQDFDRLIYSKKIFPVYLFAGEEHYLVNICLHKIEKLLSTNNLDKEILYASESSRIDILNALHTVPFLSKRRIVIVKDINVINMIDTDKLTDYLSNIVETSCLILLYYNNYKREKVLKRKKFINECIISKNCIFVNCRKRYEGELEEFIKNEFARKNNVISYNVISKIIDENDSDLLNVSNEIEKISLFVGKNKENITQDDLEKISGYTKGASIYTLSYNIEEKNVKKAMFTLEKLLSEGEESVIILSIISSTLRKMLNAKSMLEEQGMSTVEVASSLKIHSLHVEAFFVNLKKYDVNVLKKKLKTILKTDIAIKTGNNDMISALEKTILSICM
jgi:DNA polymerase-3 subunit delta